MDELPRGGTGKVLKYELRKSIPQVDRALDLHVFEGLNYIARSVGFDHSLSAKVYAALSLLLLLTGSLNI